MLKDKIFFNDIRLNLDDDIRYLEKGDIPYAVNCEFQNFGENGLLVNKKGNQLIPFTFSDQGDNYKVIGSTYDYKRDQIIYFVHSENVVPLNQSVNYILVYKDGVIQNLFSNAAYWELNYLDFKYDFKNRISATVIDDLLVWTDNNSEPKCLNLIDNQFRFFPSHTRADIFYNLMKACPMNKITARFVPRITSSTYTVSYFDDSVYQFAMKYEYYDNMMSEFGNYSNWARCFNSTVKGTFYINFDLPLGFIIYGIKKLKFYYRKNFDTYWNLFETIEFVEYNDYDVIYLSGNLYEDTGINPIKLNQISGSGNYMVMFNNSQDVLESIQDNLLFSAIPNKCKSIAFCDNRLIFANNEIGLSEPASQALILSPITEIQTAIPSGDTGFTATFGATNNIINIQFSAGNPTFPYNSLISVSGQITLTGTNIVYTSIIVLNNTTYVKKGITTDEYRESIYSSIKVYTYRVAASKWDIFSLNSSGFVSIDTVNVCSNISVSQVAFYTHGNPAAMGLSRGSKYQITYQFFDQYGRTTGPVKHENNIIDTNNLWYGILEYNPAIFGFNWEIPTGFTFPSWARYMSFGISKNLTFKNKWIEGVRSVSASFAVKAPKNYTFEEGDTVRVFKNKTGIEFQAIAYQETISGETDSGWIILEKASETFLKDLDGYEVYRRKINVENNYYEVTPRYQIINGTVIQGEVPTQFNKGYFIGGDIFFDNFFSRSNDLSMIFNVLNVGRGPIERFSYKNISINLLGKFIPKIENFAPKRYQNLYYSDKFFDNTKINGLNRVAFTSYYSLQDDYGEIAGIINRGNVLTAIQRDKVTTILVGKTEFFDSSANNNVIGKSNQVLGSNNISEQDYGTLFSNSIIKGENFIFFFDSLKKAFVAVDQSGTCIPVSNNKMVNHFNNLIISGEALVDYNILCAYDQINKMIYFTIDHKDLDGLQSLKLHEPTLKWKAFEDLLDEFGNSPENYCSINNVFVSFLKGNLYLHNNESDTNRCTFYGHSKNFVFDVVSNLNADQIKYYNQLIIHSNEPLNTTQYIDNTISYSNIRSSIDKEEFALLENKYYADFNRNELSLGSEPLIVKKYNGELLRGYAIRIRFIAENATRKIEIFKVDVNQSLSL